MSLKQQLEHCWGSAASWCCEVMQGEPNHLWDSLGLILGKGSLEQGECLRS